MMQDKIIKWFLTLLFIVSLTACSSLQLPQQSKTKIVKNDKIFVDPSIARFMKMTDRVKLQNLVATAQPEQLIKWYSTRTGIRFEFRSKRIFVNAAGEGCRNYQIKMNRGFFEHRAFNYTACRDNQGDWLVSKF
ncbi:MAG: hypothetical protein REH83_01800 [Rickettsiella sp.]|nr:hypothetical protein [Rickettsiella sp.]